MPAPPPRITATTALGSALALWACVKSRSSTFAALKLARSPYGKRGTGFVSVHAQWQPKTAIKSTSAEGKPCVKRTPLHVLGKFIALTVSCVCRGSARTARTLVAEGLSWDVERRLVFDNDVPMVLESRDASTVVL